MRLAVFQRLRASTDRGETEQAEIVLVGIGRGEIRWMYAGFGLWLIFGRSGRIRTRDHWFWRPALWPD